MRRGTDMDITELARSHHAYEKVDGAGDTFQRRARILQSIWREERDFPIGRYSPPRHDERTMGSLLEMPWAEETLANYLTDTIKHVVRSEVLDPVRRRGKVYGQPRIFDNLLSSQPLAFNLFGELQRDLELATAVLGDLAPIRISQVTRIDFEYSPGRGDPRYLNDGTAFDVFVEFTTPPGGSGFLGIEVKYHEDMRGRPARHRPEYDRVGMEMDCFADGSATRLQGMPLQQIWRDHLLMGATRHTDGYDEGCSVLLRPRDNTACARAVSAYRACLSNENTFSEWLLEDVVTALRRHTDAEWVGLFHDRYLAFDKVDTELAAASRHG